MNIENTRAKPKAAVQTPSWFIYSLVKSVTLFLPWIYGTNNYRWCFKSWNRVYCILNCKGYLNIKHYWFNSFNDLGELVDIACWSRSFFYEDFIQNVCPQGQGNFNSQKKQKWHRCFIINVVFTEGVEFACWLSCTGRFCAWSMFSRLVPKHILNICFPSWCCKVLILFKQLYRQITHSYKRTLSVAQSS